MKRHFLIVMGLVAIGATALAAYDLSWYQTQFWSGEWPNGFSVRKIGVVVQGRNTMDLDEVPTIACELPFKAVFHPWNESRNSLSQAEYWTASKIIPMTAKEDFVIASDVGLDIQVRQGEIVEWLIYHSEGGFAIRFKGQILAGEQSLLDHLEEVPREKFVQDEWLKLTCLNAVTAWLWTGDLRKVDPADGETEWVDGLGDVGNGIKEYGHAEDLTDEDLK